MATYDRARTLPHEFRAIPLRATTTTSDITLDPYDRARVDDADFQSLAASVARDGVRIPIVVDRYGDSFRILDGVRRKVAAERAGDTHVPAMVYEPLIVADALAVRFASQHATEPLWTDTEAPRVLRAVLNAQLVAKKGGRYASEYKWRMLGLASDCTKPGELSRLLRSEGITHSHLAAWRRQLDETGSFDDRRLARRAKAVNTTAFSTPTAAPAPAGSAALFV